MTGLEPLAPLAGQAISGIAVPIFQAIWAGGGKAVEKVSQTIDETTKKIIFTALKQYDQNYKKRHGILKVLGMREFVDLESIYTSVQFLDDADIRSFASIETLEEAYREAKSRRFENKECQ